MDNIEITIRILDLNGSRLALAEQRLRHMLKERDIHADIICVGCGLEIARQGFSNSVPAILMNQYLASEGRELTDEVLTEFCDKLELWISRVRERRARES